MDLMRKALLLTYLVISTIYGYSQPDPETFYAVSRLDYYTSEEVGEIAVNVPERFKEHKMAVDLVFEYESLNRAFQVASAGVSTVPFPMKQLREGQNEITVSFYQDEKWIDSRKIWVTIRPQRENAVKIERINGGLFTNGLVMVPIGFYTYIPVEPTFHTMEAVNGFNVASPYQKIEKKNP